MKGERIWHYLTLLLGQRAAKALLAEQLRKLQLAALPKKLPPAAQLRRFPLAVLPAVQATSNLSVMPSDVSEGD